MSFDVKWDIESHREEHESDEHWHLRKRFMERWKTDYPEQRLVCLARVFANIELLGCRYPTEVMQEVARLSYDVNIITFILLFTMTCLSLYSVVLILVSWVNSSFF